MKRILVPTDFSITAEKAFRFAADIAARSNGTIILYHSFIPVESNFVGTEKTREQYNLEAKAELLKRLQRLKRKVTEDYAGVPVSTIVGHSPLIENTLAFARQDHIDLIVMGTQGAGGLKKTIIGSVASRIVEKTELPVLLIPEKYDWNEPARFIFATNYQASDKQALTTIVSLAKLFKANVTVVHLYDLHVMEEEKERKDFDTYANTLQREFGDDKLEFRFLKVPAITETMENLHKTIPYDILALVRRRKTFFEKFFLNSFTQDMAYMTSLPLLVVPEKEN